MSSSGVARHRRLLSLADPRLNAWATSLFNDAPSCRTAFSGAPEPRSAREWVESSGELQLRRSVACVITMWPETGLLALPAAVGLRLAHHGCGDLGDW